MEMVMGVAIVHESERGTEKEYHESTTMKVLFACIKKS